MADPDETHVTATEARAGSTPHMGRYILGFSVVGIVVIFTLLLFVFG